MAKDRSGYKLIAQNKKAYHDFFIEETFEAGMVLVGTEVSPPSCTPQGGGRHHRPPPCSLACMGCICVP